MDKRQSLQRILLFGGTFCPPHQAHIALAQYVFTYGHFDQMFFIPCKVPVLDKTVHVSVEDRIAMLRLATQSFTQSNIDLCEVQRTTPSYTVTTLTHFRQVYGTDVSLTLLMGMDNFIQLPRWYQWDQILKYAHILVVERPGVKPMFTQLHQKLLRDHACNNTRNRENSPFGTIELINAGQFDFSSTEIRTMLRQAIDAGKNTDHWVSPAVKEYIVSHHLFIT